MAGQEILIGTTVYLNQERSVHFATAATFDFFSEKKDSDTKVGNILNLEGGVGADFLRGGLTAGLAYYGTFKLTDDEFDSRLRRGCSGRTASGGWDPRSPWRSPPRARSTASSPSAISGSWRADVHRGRRLEHPATFPIKPIRLRSRKVDMNRDPPGAMSSDHVDMHVRLRPCRRHLRPAPDAGRGAAQELEPGAYWPIPTGFNIVTIANSFNVGDLAFDPAAPIDEASAQINTSALAFTRAFSLAGRSANAGVIVPVVGGHLEGRYLGEAAEVTRFGQADQAAAGDERLRRTGDDAVSVRQVPAAHHRRDQPHDRLATRAYNSSKLINIGNNRWSFKPEVGISHAFGSWVVEGMAGVWLFTENDDFFGGRRRQQDPVVATQVHLTYRFTRTMWLAADANYFRGGRTFIGGRENFDCRATRESARRSRGR